MKCALCEAKAMIDNELCQEHAEELYIWDCIQEEIQNEIDFDEMEGYWRESQTKYTEHGEEITINQVYMD